MGTAIAHVCGAFFASGLLSIAIDLFQRWLLDRAQQRYRQEAELATGVAWTELNSDDKHLPKLREFEAQLFNPELLRNRIADAFGLLAITFHWAGTVVQFAIILGVAWMINKDGRSDASLMWALPIARILWWLAMRCIQFACHLLTGRNPGQPKLARAFLAAQLNGLPLPKENERLVLALAGLFGAAGMVAIVTTLAVSDPAPDVTAKSAAQEFDQFSVVVPSQQTIPRPVVSSVKMLSDSVRTSLNPKSLFVPSFATPEERQKYLKWVAEKSKAISPFVSSEASQRELLQAVWYESKRSGLDPALVLAVIETASGFRRFAVSESGARGLMAIAPSWASRIGDGDTGKLFITQVNLRFGCVLLRQLLDQHSGDLFKTLTDFKLVNEPESEPITSGQQFANQVNVVRKKYR